MDLNCRDMMEVDYNCPNVSTCMQNSHKPSMVKMVFYVLNQDWCQLEDIMVSVRVKDSHYTNCPLSELLQETQADLETLLANIDNFAIHQPQIDEVM